MINIIIFYPSLQSQFKSARDYKINDIEQSVLHPITFTRAKLPTTHKNAYIRLACLLP